MTAPDPHRAIDHRLWLALAASVAAHAIALAMFAGLLFRPPSSIPDKPGDPAAMQVLLRAAQAVDASTDVATPVAVAPSAFAVEPVVVPPPALKPQKPIPEPAPGRRIDLRAPPVLAASAVTPAESEADAAASAPIPPGDVAVGASENAEAMGHVQALRLAQRFPQQVAKPPQLLVPLVVPYPPAAARTHREARISALLIIDAEGNAVEATLLPDDPLFGPAVENALRQGKFKAAEVDSRPLTHWLVLEFVFSLRPSQASRAGSAR